MNDAVSLSGLARQVAQAGLLDEKGAQQAQLQAARNKLPLITYLVQNKLVKARDLAELTAEQFGVAFFDLSSLDKESQPRDLVSEKLIRQHRVLPLWRRGNKLYVGVSDPSNHQAVTDIQFSTGLNTEGVLVEDDKLGEAIEKFFDTAGGMDDLGDMDLDGLDVEAVDEDKQDSGPGNEGRRPSSTLRQQDASGCHQRRFFRSSLRAL
jgi:type IV pilus assembly protein PilB